MTASHTAFIGIGSNEGDRLANGQRAIALLSQDEHIRVIAASPWYESEAMAGDLPAPHPPYLNAAVCLSTSLAPEELLLALIEIERTLGRPHPRPKGKPRTIDLDLLLYDQLALEQPALRIPHPELHKRLFVLLPLCAIAPEVVHPVSGLTMQELLDRCQRQAPAGWVVRWKPPPQRET